MPTLMQKIRLALKGWNRRRDEKNQAFLDRNVRGGASRAEPPLQSPSQARQMQSPVVQVDIEGLIVAHLDTSQRTSYYLDTQTGDVMESKIALDGARYKPVPAASHEDDRVAFLETLDSSAHLVAADTFRERLSTDRKLERAWFNFRNDRAIAAIERWLREHRLK